MTKKTKRNLIIAGIIIVLIILAIILSIYLNNKATITTQTQISTTPPKTTETVTITPEIILNEKIFFPNLTSGSNNLIYLGDKGIIFYNYNFNTKQKNKLFDQEILGTTNAVYSPNTNYVIIFTDYPNKNIKSYNLISKQISELNNNIDRVVWNPDSKKIIYTYVDRKNNIFNINSANPDGTNRKELKKFDFISGYGLFTETDGNNIYYEQLTSELGGNKLYKFNLSNNQDTVIAQNSNYLSFSPNKQKIIISKIEPGTENTSYAVIDNNGADLKIDLNGVNINSITWSNDSKYIYSLFDVSKLIKVDTTNNTKQVFDITNSNITILPDTMSENLMVSSDNKKLYFTYNDYLYSINLP